MQGIVQSIVQGVVQGESPRHIRGIVGGVHGEKTI